MRALIGREPELGVLLSAANNPCSFILVEGEAGVGKTALVQAFATAARRKGRRTYFGHCFSLRQRFPLMPLIGALSAAGHDLPPREQLNPVLGVLHGVLPDLHDRLPPPLPALDDAWEERYLLFRAGLEMLSAIAPATVVFEDLHWADDNTFDFLRFLVPQLPAGLELVVTYRGEDLAQPLAGLRRQTNPTAFSAHLVLSPLDVWGVDELLSRILATSVPSELTHLVHQRTGGLPFAVEEVGRSLHERAPLLRGAGWSAREVQRLAVPAALRDSILERLARLSPDGQRVARAAAVLGVPAGERLLAHAAGLSDARTAHGLTELLTTALLIEKATDSYDFRHALAAKTVYDAIQPPERRELHVCAARALQPSRDGAVLRQIARHYKKAGRHDEWVAAAEAAADRFLEVGDDEAASRLLVAALRDPATLTSPSRAALAVKLSIAGRNRVVDPDAARMLAAVVEEPAIPREIRGELRLRLGVLLFNEGSQTARARQELARALPDLEAPVLILWTYLGLAQPYSMDETRSDHLRWIDDAVATAQASVDPELARVVRVVRPAHLMCVGDPRWEEAFNDMPLGASTKTERRDLAMGYLNLTEAALYVGHYRRADEFRVACSDLFPQAAEGPYQFSMAAAGFVIDWTQGRWDDLAARAQRHLDTPGVRKMDLVEAHLALGLVLLAENDRTRAEAALRAAKQSAAASGLAPAYVMACAGLARIYLGRDTVRASAQVSDGVDLLRRKDMWVWGAELVPVAVEVLLREHRTAEARELVAEVERGLSNLDAPAARPAALMGQARVAEAEGGVARAAELYAAARDAWLAIGRIYDAALAAERRAGALQMVDHDAARRLLELSLQEIADLGAEFDYRRVRTAVIAAGGSIPSRAGRKAYGNLLSPREAEVVELAAAGNSNSEIAAVLVLSQHTVAKHLLRAMHKLGVRSRSSLPSALRSAAAR